jgi:4-hydroxy-tetrahydrodipicolinate reductase
MNALRIGLIGYGKMGKMVEAAARERGHEIVSVSDPFEKSAMPSQHEKADVLVEFTRPDTALDNIKTAAALGKPIVVGSTGWYERLPEAVSVVEQYGTSLLWSSNFSLGVNLLYRIASYAAAVIDPFPEYDVAGYEVHHNKKADSPSGTAETLVKNVLASMKRKTKVLWGNPKGRVDTDTIHYASLRVGSVPGIHTLSFDSPADTIEISHTARSREGFASGAVIAAEWLAAGKRRGVFTMDDALKEILK